MKKKIKVITVIDPAQKNGDAGAYVQAAVDGKGVIHILRTGSYPIFPVRTPTSDIYKRLEDTIKKQELKFSSGMVDGMNEWINTSHYIVPMSPSKRRPPSTHKRVFKKGRRIKTIAALDKHLSLGGWIFWGHQKRAVHPGWVMSWQYTMVRNSLGKMWKAVRI